MILEVGKRIKIRSNYSSKRDGIKTGIISLVTKDYIQVKLENYKECFQIEEIKANRDYKFYIKQNKTWIKVERRMLEQW